MSWQFIVAVGLLVAFVAMVIYMLVTSDGDATTWERQVYVFGAVEAIVFTAVGWIFGREVHRAGAQDARQDAKEAKEDAAAKGEKVEELTEEVAKGRTLAAAIEATEAVEAGQRPRAARGPSDVTAAPRVEAPQSADVSLATLRSLAKKLYDD